MRLYSITLDYMRLYSIKGAWSAVRSHLNIVIIRFGVGVSCVDFWGVVAE